MTADDLKIRANQVVALDEKIEMLKDDRSDMARELERRAYLLASAKVGIISRTTEDTIFSGISESDPDLVNFNTYDSYDCEWTTSCSFTFDQLADHEAEAKRIIRKRKEKGLEQAQKDLELAKERVKRLGGSDE